MAKKPITVVPAAKKKNNIPQGGVKEKLAVAGLHGMGNINSTFDSAANLLLALKKNGISRAQYDLIKNRAKIEKWSKDKVNKFKSQTEMDEGLAILLAAMKRQK